MLEQKLPKAPLARLAHAHQTWGSQPEWLAILEWLRITEPRHVRIATEGALLGSVLEHGANRELVIVSDDAGQFDVLRHALCWIHAERIFVKLVRNLSTTLRHRPSRFTEQGLLWLVSRVG